MNKVMFEEHIRQIIKNEIGIQKDIQTGFKTNNFTFIQRLIDRESPIPALNLPPKNGRKLRTIILSHPEQCAYWVKLGITEGQKEFRESIVKKHFGLIHSLIAEAVESATVKSADTDAKSLANILALPRLDGGQWPLLFDLVAKEFDLPIEGPRGKVGCKALVALGCEKAEIILANAVHDDSLQRIVTAKATVQRLFDIDAQLKQWEAVSLAESLPQLSIPLVNTDQNEDNQDNTPSELFSLEIRIVSGKGAITRSLPSEGYPQGTPVTLTAIPKDGYHFKSWGGDARGSENVCSVIMNSNRVVSVRFAQIVSFRLDVQVQGNGTVLPRDLANVYVENSYVTLTAQAAVGSQFNGWYGDARGISNVCAIKMDSMKTVVARFAKSKVVKNEPVTTVQRQHIEPLPERERILHRLALLDMKALRKIDALQIASANTPVTVGTLQTLPEVMAWLSTQVTVQITDLRLKLLPLDLLPSAVIDDINERAYDLAGEAALEDSDGAVSVQREVLLQVLAAWGE